MILICLAVIQGVAEFIPVSSSGHLVLVQHLDPVKRYLQIIGQDTELFISVALHLATLIAVIIYLYRDIITLLKGTLESFIKREWKNREIRTLLYVFTASIPAGVFGLLLHDLIESFFSSVSAVLWLLILNGLILISTKIIPLKCRNIEEMGIVRSLAVGCFQAFAVLPGISRSGTTITGGMLCGLKPVEAARFSFLMAIPVIAGAGLLETLKLGRKGIIPEIAIPLGISMMIALVTGLISLKVLFILVKRVRIYLFGYYTMGLGILGLIIYSS